MASTPSPSVTTLWPADSRMSPSTARTGGSSSTTRHRSARTAGAEAGGAGGVGCTSLLRGNDSRNVEPRPGSLSTAIEPPWRDTMP